MHDDIKYRKLLCQRWTRTLTESQRNAWNVYAFFCPGVNSVSLDNSHSGKEMFILCNLPKRK